MKISKILQVAWIGLTRNKLRSLLTMLGVIIGVAAVIVMISISAGTEAAIADEITGLGSNLIYVNQAFTRMGPGSTSSGSGLVEEDAPAIKEIDGVVATVIEQTTTSSLEAGSNTLEDVTIIGSTADYPSVRDIEIAEGRFFTDSEVDSTQKAIILGADVATELFGDVSPIGETVTLDTLKLTVIGVFKERGVSGDTDFDAQVYVPSSIIFKYLVTNQFARMFGNNVRTIYVEIEEDADMDNIILQIQLLLTKRHEVSLDEADFTITTQQDIISTQEATTEAFRNLLAWVAAVSLIVGGIGIMNIMLVSVTERTQEIGIRQSVGATPNDIRMQFLAEALLLSLVGGLLGVVFGVGGSYIYGNVSDMRTVIEVGSIILAFSSAAAIGVFFGFYPANQAAMLDPIDALRHE